MEQKLIENEEKEILDLYRSVGALLEGHFILSSGLHSKIYLQSALIFSRPDIAKIICSKLVKKIIEKVNIKEINYIVSPAMGGVLLGYEVSRQTGLPNIFVERVDGVFNIRRGFKITKGNRVLVVEDIVTTSKSSLECFKCIKEYGGEVVAEAALINRGGDVDLGVPLICLASINIPNYEANSLPKELEQIEAIKPGSRSI